MLTQRRLEWIRQELHRMGGLRTRETARLLDVSIMTIWRDFESLESAGELRRVHGGALPPPPQSISEPDFSSKAIWMSDDRQALAIYAARRFFRPGMSVSLEGGSTVVGLLNHLRTPNLTLLTNSIEVLRSAPAGCTIHGSGGEYRPVSRTFVGPQAIGFFKNHHTDLCIISATGFDTKRGLTDPNPLEVEVKRAMCLQSSKTVLLLDTSKFDKSSLCQLIEVERIHTLVTNVATSKTALKPFRKAGVMIELV